MPLKFVVNNLCKPFAYDNFLVVFLVCNFSQCYCNSKV